MHNRKKLNIGMSSLILGAFFLEFNVSQVKADNVKTDSNYTEQVNTKIINQNVTSKNNVTAQNSVAPSKYEASLVSSSTGTNIQNNLNGELLDSKEVKTVENGVQNSNNTVHHQSTPVTMLVNKDSTNKWRYNSNIKTWSYIKSDGSDANQEWVKTKYNEWYYFDENGSMATNGWFSTSSKKENNGEKYYFDKDGHYLTNHWVYDSAVNIWSYVKKDGTQAHEEWLKLADGHWYYFDVSGIMAADGWKLTTWGVDNAEEYYFDDYGVMVTNGWYDTLSKGSWKKYYFDKNGHPLTLHLTTEFDKNGSPITNHWVYDSKNKLWAIQSMMELQH